MRIPYSESTPDEEVGGVSVRRWGKTANLDQFYRDVKEQIEKDELTKFHGDYSLDFVKVNLYPACKLKYKNTPENFPGVLFDTMQVEKYLYFYRSGNIRDNVNHSGEKL